MPSRYVTLAENPRSENRRSRTTDSTTSGADWEVFSGRGDPEQRYRLYRLCPCLDCSGTGKTYESPHVKVRCGGCRGEGRILDLVATAETPEAVGVALVTLAREGEWTECPFGLLDPEGDLGQRWLIRPFAPSARNVSDAGKVLQTARWRLTA